VTLAARDRLDILELLARADNAATRRDAAGYARLFSDDAILDGAKGEHRGHDELITAVGQVWAAEGKDSVHLTLNAVIDENGDRPGSATATLVLVIIDPGPPPMLRSVSTIVQRLEKSVEGWKITRRTVSSP
jgi:ketosteroid isomerase-like protein